MKVDSVFIGRNGIVQADASECLSQINFIFFMHITWVLLSKLRSSVSAETRKYRYR